MTLPEKLAKLRKAAGLSQEEVADKLELTRQTISKWETGQSSPDLDKVLPLCNLYNVTPDELLHDDNKKSHKTEDQKSTAPATEELPEKNITPSDESYNKTSPSPNHLITKRKLIGILFGIFIYIVAVVFIMISIPVIGINPIISSGIFLLLLAIGTLTIIFSAINYRDTRKNKLFPTGQNPKVLNLEKNKDKKEKDNTLTKETQIYETINYVLRRTTLVVYLIVSFMTMAWHITWIIWVIYGIVAQIIKLATLLITDDSTNQ
ncbi:MAG: helix-turn-helix transcriptional regulator [Candidatus Saccharibacteria bacterium]|nr:helix-turn-helix transcriptional regulator [Candidatus Saccharibacteria bacterium]